MTEEKIWPHFEKAVGAISINQSLAEQIMEALNEAHQKVRSAKKREIEEFRQALKQLEEQEDFLYADLRNHRLEELQYQRMISKVRADRDYYTKLLEDANEALDGIYLETADSILKLATDAKTLWNSRNAQEKRDFLDRILSNPVLDGPTIRYDLRKPFAVLAEMTSASDWRLFVDQFRTAMAFSENRRYCRS